MPKGRSWPEESKNNNDLPRSEEKRRQDQREMGYGTVVIPAQNEVDELTRKVPQGKLSARYDKRRRQFYFLLAYPKSWFGHKREVSRRNWRTKETCSNED